jgi:hypothetical protein
MPVELDQCPEIEAAYVQGESMTENMSKARRRVLVQLESILGNECYNANIQNYGPGGVREAVGRAFRYPVTLRLNDGTTTKVRQNMIPPDVPDDMVRSGYYAFGANQLDVMEGLEKILKFLEKHHGLVLEGC